MLAVLPWTIFRQMKFKLFDYQNKAVKELKTGSILWGGVGSGKSLTSLAYYYSAVCGGSIEPKLTRMKNPIPLYVITTARKRDELDWEDEASYFGISKNSTFVVDSWNNIAKYVDVEGAFFIFDEQKVVGYGSWVKSFLKIAKKNKWILLTATPGDVWMDYVPLFIANGFFRNKTDFINQHVVYSNFTNFPKIDRYVNVGRLVKLRNSIVVKMDYVNKTKRHSLSLPCSYNREELLLVEKERWNPFEKRPVKTAAEACYTMRKIVNSHPSRLEHILTLLKKHPRLIIFYNFDYELDILRGLNEKLNIPIAEYNGHLHEPVPKGESWIYLAQYLSAGEAWNCIETNTIVLYSRNYSYKQTIQAMGRIDRQNTPFVNLYFYFLESTAKIDRGIAAAFSQKKNFNESKFLKD